MRVIKHLFSFIKPYLLLSLVIFLVYSCSSGGAHNEFLKNIDTLKNSYARGFRIITTHEGYIAEVINPWQNAKNITFRYFLVRNNRNQFPNGLMTIPIPVKKVVCLSSTHIAFVSALNEIGTIRGISGLNNVYNNVLIELGKKGYLFEAGYENNLNYEKIIKLKPDVVFAYGIGSEINGYVSKLNELGIPVILVGEYLEQHPLARTEWLKFFAVFYDKLTEAEKIFAHTDSLYQYWKSKGMSYSFRPKVMSGLPWNGSWYISGAYTYMAQLINDAGGHYLWNDQLNNISIPMDFETVFNRCRNADYWINIGTASSKEEILNTDKRLGLFSPFIKNHLFNNNARVRPQGGNDYWESGVINPHLILSDLVKIFHPTDFAADSLFYYKQIH